MASFSCSRLIALYAVSAQLHGAHAQWTPIIDPKAAQLSSHGGADYDWQGQSPPLSPPTATGTACDVTNTNRWLGWPNGQKPQEQLDAFATKWGGSHQSATSPAGNPMIATFGHCLVQGPLGTDGTPTMAEQHCGQCGMIKFEQGMTYQISTGSTFVAETNLDILVMCLDTATWSYEIDRGDFSNAIARLGAIAQTGDTDAHPIVTEIALADCLSGDVPVVTTQPTSAPTEGTTTSVPTTAPTAPEATSTPTSAPTSAAPTAAPTQASENCKSWCGVNTRPWATKCAWAHSCNHCSDCSTSAPTPAPERRLRGSVLVVVNMTTV